MNTHVAACFSNRFAIIVNFLYSGALSRFPTFLLATPIPLAYRDFSLGISFWLQQSPAASLPPSQKTYTTVFWYTHSHVLTPPYIRTHTSTHLCTHTHRPSSNKTTHRLAYISKCFCPFSVFIILILVSLLCECLCMDVYVCVCPICNCVYPGALAHAYFKQQ